MARVLRSMVATRVIPLGLMTSFDASHPELRNLTVDIGLVCDVRDINAELDSAVKCLIPAAQ